MRSRNVPIAGRARLSALMAAGLALSALTPASGQASCRPALTVKNIQFSPMRPPALQRTWTAVVAVDAARCAANSSGEFAILFTRAKEVGLDADFRERFTWRSPAVDVAVTFWADESVAHYRVVDVAPCRCRD
jgi:hypothetical protein